MKNNDIPIFLVVLGSIELIIPLSTVILILPQLSKLEYSLNTGAFNPILTYSFFGLAITIGVIQIARGLFFKKSNQKYSEVLLAAGGIIGLLAIPALIFLVIEPIYKIIGS